MIEVSCLSEANSDAVLCSSTDYQDMPLYVKHLDRTRLVDAGRVLSATVSDAYVGVVGENGSCSEFKRGRIVLLELGGGVSVTTLWADCSMVFVPATQSGNPVKMDSIGYEVDSNADKWGTAVFETPSRDFSAREGAVNG